MAIIALRGELVMPDRKVRTCRDPNGDMLIEAALTGAAGYVVMGDKDLLVLKAFEAVRFVTPSAFLARL